jgi:putative hemolysin
MNLSVVTLLVSVPPLLLIEGFFAGSEISLLSADKLVLKSNAQKGSRRAKLALELSNKPERVLSTTLLATSLCVIAISSLIALFVLSRGIAHADLVSVALTSPLVVLLGELIPKTIYQRYATQLAPWVAFPLHVTYIVFYPFTKLLSTYTTKLSRLVGPIEEMLTGKRRTTREELRSLLSYNRKETDIKASEKRMIKRIFDFKDTEAKHALIPLVKVEAIDESETIREALERFQRHRHSRMPVFSERIDNIVGVLEANDLFGVLDLNQPIRNYVSNAHYVAETQSLEDLMIDMRREDIQMVVVVDEYGGAIGVLTFEDIIEEIVGEINDEYDSEGALFREVTETKWLVQSRMEIQAINERLRLDLPEGDYETLSGFLLQQFGKIPDIRDELYFDTSSGTLKFTIRKATQRQIESVEIEKLSSPTPQAD